MSEQPPRPATLGDLGRTDVDVIIELPGGDEVLIPMRSLSYHRYNAIRWSVPDPAPPVNGVDKNGRPVFDYHDATHLKRVADAGLERTYRLLLASLKLDIPGESDEEKLQYLRDEMDGAIVRQLMNVMEQIATKGSARIAARAGAFPGGRNAGGGDTNAGALGADTGGVG